MLGGGRRWGGKVMGGGRWVEKRCNCQQERRGGKAAEGVWRKGVTGGVGWVEERSNGQQKVFGEKERDKSKVTLKQRR